ncbi:hypothetical protein [Variovorax paradoxus]|uniref:hypothetical protein n=1 Tax=Variovorax paradoxus TaxID=34073 RepID=UPI003D651480
MSTSYFATFVTAEHAEALSAADAKSIGEVLENVVERSGQGLILGTESNYWMLASVLDYFSNLQAFPYQGSARGERLGSMTEAVVLFVPSDEARSVLDACTSVDPRKDKEMFRKKTSAWFSEVRPDFEIDNDDDFEDLMANAIGLLSALETAEKNDFGLLVIA